MATPKEKEPQTDVHPRAGPTAQVLQPVSPRGVPSLSWGSTQARGGSKGPLQHPVIGVGEGVGFLHKENSCLKWAASFLQKVVGVPVTGLDAREIPRDPATGRAAGPVGSRMVTSP